MSTATVSKSDSTHAQEMSITCAHKEDMHKKEEKIDTFEFVRLKIPKLIPRDLIDNVKGRTFTVDQFYDYQTKQVGNPYNFLYALVDQDKKIHGYLWAETNLLDGSLFVNTFSVSKEHWGKGEAIEKACEFLKVLKKTSKASRVFWVTTNEKFFIKKGFKKSKNVLMEYNSN